MEQVLINQKSLKQKKNIKQIQKIAFRKYGRGHRAVVKAKMGKLVSLFRQETTKLNNKKITIPTLSQKDLLDKIRDNELTGMSGNDFPTAQKLENFLQSEGKERILIVNGVECEPGLLHDEWLLEHCIDEIIAGIRILSKTLQINHSVLATKTDKKLEENEIEILRVPARYPMGEEHILLRQLFGIDLDKTTHPAENGFLVLNVQTVYQIYLLCNGMYQKGRYVTLADIDTGEAKVIFVKNGENIRSILENNFGKEKNKKYFAGGGILSAHPVNENECFKGNISFASVGTPADISNENHCKKCGKCSRKCPMGVNVKEIVARREQNTDADITGLGLEKCIHCNSCTYFCRAGKNIAAMLV